MLSYVRLTRQRIGQLCYTSGVIGWAASGRGTLNFATFQMNRDPVPNSTGKIAPGNVILRGEHRVFDRGKGF